jgi:hypothetical protein
MIKSSSTGAYEIALRPEALSRQMCRLHVPSASDEMLVLDARHDMRPCEMVEKKLASLLSDASRPMSHTLTRGLSNGRNHR